MLGYEDSGFGGLVLHPIDTQIGFDEGNRGCGLEWVPTAQISPLRPVS